MTKRIVPLAAIFALFVLSGAAAPSFAEPSKCDAAKVKAAGKKLAAKTKCYAKALQKELSVDPECLAKAEQKFENAFQKANDKNDNCTNVGDTVAVESTVDACLADLVLQVSVTACAVGEVNCNGACADLATDVSNCGACGNACAIGATCTSGVCDCPAGTVLCSGVCADLATDVSNCGACGIACASPQICTSGTCQ